MHYSNKQRIYFNHTVLTNHILYNKYKLYRYIGIGKNKNVITFSAVDNHIFSLKTVSHTFFPVSHILYIIYIYIYMGIPAEFFFLLHLLNVSPWGHVRRRGGKKKRFACRKILSIYIRSHTSKKKKRKKEYVEKGSRETYIYIYILFSLVVVVV